MASGKAHGFFKYRYFYKNIPIFIPDAIFFVEFSYIMHRLSEIRQQVPIYRQIPRYLVNAVYTWHYTNANKLLLNIVFLTGDIMSFLHFYNFSRFSISMTYLKLALFRMKWPSCYTKAFILFCLPINTALADEIFSTSFASGSLEIGAQQENGFYWKVPTRATVSTENPKTGTHSLRLAFQPATAESGSTHSRAQADYALGGRYPDLWIKYDMFVPSNYKHRATGSLVKTYNNKFMMVWGGDYSDSTKKEGPKLGAHYYPEGNNESKLIAYAGSRVNGVTNIDNNWTCPKGSLVRGVSACTGGKGPNAITTNDVGHWMTLVVHMKYASKANNDGVYEIWKTNWQGQTEKLIDIQDGPWYGSQALSTLPARGFDNGYFLGAHNSGYAVETVFYIDNITFSTSPLVANYINVPYISPPKPPTLLSSN